MVTVPAAAATGADGAPHRFVALDSLRGVMAMAVVFHHIDAVAGLAAQPWHDMLGEVVDAFFVLSGFVIAAAYGDRLAAGYPLRRFLLLRLGRLYPLHLATLLVALLSEVGLALVLPAGSGRAAFTGPRDPAMLPAVLLLVQAFVYPGADLWNVQSWSISVEVWMNLLVAALWRGAGRVMPWLALAAAALLVAMTSAPGLIGTQWPIARGLAGFGCGMAAYALHRRLERRISPGPVLATLAEAAVCALVAWSVIAGWPLGLFDPAFALAVLVFARDGGAISRLLATPPFALLGVLSYAIYMVHGWWVGRMFDLLALAGRFTGEPLVFSRLAGERWLLGPGWRADLLALAIMASVVPVAWAAWRSIEWPARAWSRRLAARLDGA